jgi:hypothetical protein
MRMRLVATAGDDCQVTAVLVGQPFAEYEVGSTVSVDVPEQANAHIRQRSPI